MDSFELYLTKAVKYLASRPRSEREVRDNLKKKKAKKQVIEKIVQLLKKQKFLDDREFAKWWIRQRITFRPKSKRVLRLELLQKGIAKELIDQTLLDDDKEEKVDDTELAKRLVEKQLSKYRKLNRQELYRKLGSYLARRGFDWETIRASIDEAFGKGYNKLESDNSELSDE